MKLPTLETVLRAALFVSIIAAGVAAALTVHPLVGAVGTTVGFGAWWGVLSARTAETERATRQAAAMARSRSPLDTSFESAARPVLPGDDTQWGTS